MNAWDKVVGVLQEIEVLAKQSGVQSDIENEIMTLIKKKAGSGLAQLNAVSLPDDHQVSKSDNANVVDLEGSASVEGSAKG